jgi:hypothetical protein
MSEETEDKPDVIEDSDASGDEAHEDVAFLASKRHRRVVDDLIETAESSPSGRSDDDANVSPPDAPSREASAPPAPKKSSSFFADEDDFMSISQVPFPYVSSLILFGNIHLIMVHVSSNSSDEDTNTPPLKKTKISSEKPESTKESTPLSSKDEPA